MSRLRSPEGEDHPDAALKHLLDAEVLLSQERPDGAAYLSGYVIECAMKTMVILEEGPPAPRLHGFGSLVQQVYLVSAVAGAKTAKYFGPVTRGVLSSAIRNWRPEMRYLAPSMALAEGRDWYACAWGVFEETVHEMRLDGVI
jgi:hypothetical protein